MPLTQRSSISKMSSFASKSSSNTRMGNQMKKQSSKFSTLTAVGRRIRSFAKKWHKERSKRRVMRLINMSKISCIS